MNLWISQTVQLRGLPASLCVTNSPDAQHSSCQSMRPFHVKDLLKALHIKLRIRNDTLGRHLVLFPFDCPLFLSDRRQDPLDGFPFRDGKAGFGKTGDAAHDDDEEDQAGGDV